MLMSEAESSDIGKELTYGLSIAKKHSFGREGKKDIWSNYFQNNILQT